MAPIVDAESLVEARLTGALVDGDLALGSLEPCRTDAVVRVRVVDADRSVHARLAQALVDVRLAQDAREPDAAVAHEPSHAGLLGDADAAVLTGELHAGVQALGAHWASEPAPA